MAKILKEVLCLHNMEMFLWPINSQGSNPRPADTRKGRHCFMLYKFKMPDLSTTGDEVDVKQWLVNVGDRITRGQAILEIETDKAVMDVESPVEGVLREWVAQPDTTVGVGTIIAHIETESR